MSQNFYAAYGSNVNSDQMCKRCLNAKFVQTDILENYLFVFATDENDGTDCVANIVYAPGEETPIAIYKMSDSDLERLDKREGVHKGKYRRVTKRAKDLDEDLICYVLEKEHESNPAIEIRGNRYVDTIIRGLEARKMGTCHVNRAEKRVKQERQRINDNA